MRKGFLNNPTSKSRKSTVTPKTTTTATSEKAAKVRVNKEQPEANSKGSSLDGYAEKEPSTVKMPIGKLDTSLPSNYVPGSFQGSLRSMLVPPRPSPTTYDPDGHTACIFYHPSGLEEKFIFSNPKFPAPIAKTPVPPFKIAPSKLGGVGLFATVDLKLNDLIHSERPLMLVPPGLLSMDPPAYAPGTSELQVQMAHIAEMNYLYTRELKNLMTEDDLKLYMDLNNSHTEDGSGDVVGRLRTNGWGVSLFKGREKERDGLLPSTAVYKTFSRINHSCTPNSGIQFHMAQFAAELRAVRDIKAGEEIFAAYCSANDLYDVRTKDLKPYGFTCTCPHCNIPPEDGGPKSFDLIREKFKAKAMVLRPVHQKLFYDPAASCSQKEVLILLECDQLMTEMDKLGLECMSCYGDFLQGKAMGLTHIGRPALSTPVWKKYVAREEALMGNLGARDILKFLQ